MNYPSNRIKITVRTHVKRGKSLTHTLLYELICDASRWMLIENRIHQGNFGRAPSRFGFGRAELRRSKMLFKPHCNRILKMLTEFTSKRSSRENIRQKNMQTQMATKHTIIYFSEDLREMHWRKQRECCLPENSRSSFPRGD